MSHSWSDDQDPGYLCTCGDWHHSGGECPTQGRTELEVEQDRVSASRCPDCRQMEDCLCLELKARQEETTEDILRHAALETEEEAPECVEGDGRPGIHTHGRASGDPCCGQHKDCPEWFQ